MNQSGRMEKTRKIIEANPSAFISHGWTREDVAAALAEVEEWETRLAAADRTRFQADNMVVVPEDALIRAEAEADRLKAALAPVQEYLRKHYFLDEIHDEDEPLVVMLTAAEIRAALAPADRNTDE